ncbi:MAG TPA: hypothetical protein VHE55_19365 [Fimbriimonadaceae bacterium]|nr:hypothetical protein [Fimbriimonadaceae bacterium]
MGCLLLGQHHGLRRRYSPEIIGLLIAWQPFPLKPDWDLITYPKVQAELRLTRGQIHQIDSILAKNRKELLIKKGPPITEAISFEGKVHQMALPALQRIGGGLRPSQRTRVLQVSLWQWGPNVVAYPGMSDTIGIDHSRVEQIETKLGEVSIDFAHRIQTYAKAHHIKMLYLKGGVEKPIETPAIRRIEAQREAEQWRVLYSQIGKERATKLKRLLGRPFSFK